MKALAPCGHDHEEGELLNDECLIAHQRHINRLVAAAAGIVPAVTKSVAEIEAKYPTVGPVRITTPARNLIREYLELEGTPCKAVQRELHESAWSGDEQELDARIASLKRKMAFLAGDIAYWKKHKPQWFRKPEMKIEPCFPATAVPR